MKQNGIFTKLNKFLISKILCVGKNKTHEVGGIDRRQDI